MNCNDFNNRINLQAFCEANGVKGYSFVRMPRFGWFAVNKVDNEIRTLIDFIPMNDMVNFCTDLIMEKTQYHEGRIMYNEVTVTKLCNAIRIRLLLKKFHQDCKAEYHEGATYTSGKTRCLAEMFKENGMDAFADTGVGVISDLIHKTYRVELALPHSLKGKLVIPTWCTPQHTASFESCSITEPNRRTSFIVEGEKGWYGKPIKTVYGNFTNLMTHQGCTWDKKLNYWVDKPLDLDESLDVSKCLQIWTEASPNLSFKRDPLSIIEATNGVGKVKLNLQALSANQTSELEKRFKTPLMALWKTQKQVEVVVSRMPFIYKDMRYYRVCSDGNLEEFTNFAVEITRVYKKDNVFYRQGYVYFEGRQEPFELPNVQFFSSSIFFRALNWFFLNRGIGVPWVDSSLLRVLVDVINKFNANFTIDHEG